jgi:hypothetical protein
MPRIKPTKRQAAPREDEPPVERQAMSIRQFCRAHDLSIDSYYRMAREGSGPEIMKVGHRTLIARESAEAWRRAREAAAREQRRARDAVSADEAHSG